MQVCEIARKCADYKPKNSDLEWLKKHAGHTVRLVRRLSYGPILLRADDGTVGAALSDETENWRTVRPSQKPTGQASLWSEE